MEIIPLHSCSLKRQAFPFHQHSLELYKDTQEECQLPPSLKWPDLFHDKLANICSKLVAVGQ